MGNYMEDVLSQPDEIGQCLEYYEKSGLLEKINQLYGMPFEKLIFSGMGSSHFCAVGAGIFLKQHGIDNQVISTGELLYYEKEILNKKTLLILISQSGESAEIVILLEQLSEEVTIIAITNETESTLASKGELVLPLHVGEEEAVTTRTYMASICVSMLLASAIAEGNAFGMMQRIKRCLFLMEKTLSEQYNWNEIMQKFLKDCPVMSIMGRGYSLGSVQAGALFFREIVKFPAMAFDEAEFKHGPLEMVEPGFHAVIFAPAGPGSVMNIKMAENIVSKGGMAVLITDEDCRVEAHERLFLIRLEKTEEYLVPLIQILPIQLMADYLAKQKGIPAGTFRWGSKVMDSEI